MTFHLATDIGEVLDAALLGAVGGAGSGVGDAARGAGGPRPDGQSPGKKPARMRASSTG